MGTSHPPPPQSGPLVSGTYSSSDLANPTDLEYEHSSQRLPAVQDKDLRIKFVLAESRLSNTAKFQMGSVTLLQ